MREASSVVVVQRQEDLYELHTRTSASCSGTSGGASTKGDRFTACRTFGSYKIASSASSVSSRPCRFRLKCSTSIPARRSASHHHSHLVFHARTFFFALGMSGTMEGDFVLLCFESSSDFFSMSITLHPAAQTISGSFTVGFMGHGRAGKLPRGLFASRLYKQLTFVLVMFLYFLSR